MGMFDYITYKDHQYQTKCTPAQGLDNYQIRDDGTLWYEKYQADWIENDSIFGGYLEKKNEEWVFCSDFTGEIRFYRHLDKTYKNWEEFSSYFHLGIMKEIHLLESKDAS
jgi:hypothetical protein